MPLGCAAANVVSTNSAFSYVCFKLLHVHRSCRRASNAGVADAIPDTTVCRDGEEMTDLVSSCRTGGKRPP